MEYTSEEQFLERVKKLLKEQNRFRKDAKGTKGLFFASLFGLASLREIVHLFTRS
jgi:hypothetical protein